MTKKVFIFTDGACNKTSGSWAIVYQIEGLKEIKSLSGKINSNTTNNRMELIAVINALKLSESLGFNPVIFSDSAYIVNTLNKNWYSKWKLSNKSYANKDLWDILVPLFKKLNAVIVHIRRNSNELHKLADKLAKKESHS